MDWIHRSEGAKAVTTGPMIGDLVPNTADGVIGDAAQAVGRVDRDEGVDLSLEGVLEQVLRAPKVARSLLPDVCDKVDSACRLDLGFLIGPGDGKQHGETAAVVA